MTCGAAFAEPYVVVPEEPKFSRWHGDDVSLSGRMRLVWTILIVLTPLFALAYFGFIGIFFVVAWLCVAPTFLRDVWKPTRVRTPTR